MKQLQAALVSVTAYTQILEDVIAAKLGINLADFSFEYARGDVAESAKTQEPCDGSATREVVQGGGTLKSGQDNTHLPSINDKCKLLNWNGNGEIVLRGFISAIDSKSTVHGYTLGSDCYRISIEDMYVEIAEFYHTELKFAILKMHVEVQLLGQ